MNRKIDFSLILQNVEKHIQLDKSEQEYFISLLDYKKIKNKKIIHSEGSYCTNSIFVLNGCLRGYTIDKDGFEHILNFAPRDWWIGDLYSLLSHKPGILNIESIEDSEILLLKRDDQEELYKKVPKFERFFRIIIEKSLVAYQQRIIDNLSLTAEERYQKFCKKYPMLINSISQKHIAAYIGITPEFLSKLRKEIYKKS